MKTVFNPMIIRAALHRCVAHVHVVIWINQRGEPIGFCHE